MALANKRLIVPISADDKRLVAAKAAHIGKLTIAEFVAGSRHHDAAPPRLNGPQDFTGRR